MPSGIPEPNQLELWVRTRRVGSAAPAAVYLTYVDEALRTVYRDSSPFMVGVNVSDAADQTRYRIENGLIPSWVGRTPQDGRTPIAGYRRDYVSPLGSVYWQRPNAADPITYPPEPPRRFGRAIPPRDMPVGIESVGVELECGVDQSGMEIIENLLGTRMESHGDGSVHVDSMDYESEEFTFWSPSLAEMEDWLKMMYDEAGVATNASCGFHIHVKPTPPLLPLYASKDYWEGFYTEYRRYADGRRKYLGRMNGDWSRAREWDLTAVSNAWIGQGERYTAINLDSLHKHRIGAVEHRIMPRQDDAAEANTTVRWLASTASKLTTAPTITIAEEDIAGTLYLPPERLVVPEYEGLDTLFG